MGDVIALEAEAARWMAVGQDFEEAALPNLADIIAAESEVVVAEAAGGEASSTQPKSALENDAKKKWKVGAKVLVYSRSYKKWCEGIITKSKTVDNLEWVYVLYKSMTGVKQKKARINDNKTIRLYSELGKSVKEDQVLKRSGPNAGELGSEIKWDEVAKRLDPRAGGRWDEFRKDMAMKGFTGGHSPVEKLLVQQPQRLDLCDYLFQQVKNYMKIISKLLELSEEETQLFLHQVINQFRIQFSSEHETGLVKYDIETRNAFEDW